MFNNVLDVGIRFLFNNRVLDERDVESHVT